MRGEKGEWGEEVREDTHTNSVLQCDGQATRREERLHARQIFHTEIVLHLDQLLAVSAVAQCPKVAQNSYIIFLHLRYRPRFYLKWKCPFPSSSWASSHMLGMHGCASYCKHHQLKCEGQTEELSGGDFNTRGIHGYLACGRKPMMRKGGGTSILRDGRYSFPSDTSSCPLGWGSVTSFSSGRMYYYSFCCHFF
jgi:hypothetical protein